MDLFEQRLLAEGIRAIEGDSPSLDFSESSLPAQHSFEQRLIARAFALDSKLQVTALLSHFKGLTRHLYQLLAICLLLLGASSVQQLFFTEQGTQINFFWAFALFFIPNFISLCLWLLLYFRKRFSSYRWLARFSLLLLTQAEKRFNQQATQNAHFWPVFRRYFKINFSDFLGRDQLSALSHLLWLSYFIGATVMLILMLATHQVDFIWQTSILSLENFQELTKLLAYIPNLLGITVPDPTAIEQSNITIINSISDPQQSRFAWSSLLISSLIIYGVLPRLLLWLLMRMLFTRKTAQFQLDLSNAYYVQLRQQLQPNVTALGITDPDLSKATPVADITTTISTDSLPKAFFPVAIELSAAELTLCSAHLNKTVAQPHEPLSNICDFAAQQLLLTRFSTIKQSAIVLYVSISRIPDRGLAGFIRALTGAGDKTFYLLLIDTQEQQLDQRRSGWYQLAAQAGISLDNIIHFKTDTLERYE